MFSSSMMGQNSSKIKLFNLDQKHDLGLEYMSDSDNSDTEQDISGNKASPRFTQSYDLTDNVSGYDAAYDLCTDKKLIDCTVIPSIAFEEILRDVSSFELDDALDLQNNIQNYDDAAYWVTALVNLSPTGALLLKNAVHFDWHMSFESLENIGWSLNTEHYVASINKAQLSVKSLSRSPFFMNTIVCDFIRSLRDIWLEEKTDIDYQDYHPETILKMERMRAADIEALTLQVAWELRSVGYSVLWRHILGSDKGDMAMLFTRFLEHDPASLFDGSALLVAFKQWYADDERINAADRSALEICDDILFTSDKNKRVFANTSLCKESLAAFFALPEGRLYLSSVIPEIMKSPYFSSMQDPINEAHLYHIIRDLEVCYVGNVPFRNPQLADKIFPDYTKILK
jgi:hypothetical protein